MTVESIKRAGLGAVALLTSVLSAGCGGSESRPGDAAVYQDIQQESDCTALHDGLDRNVADAARRADGDPLNAVVTAYATAYAERLAELECTRRR